MMKVVCLDDFFVDSFGSEFFFMKGKMYNYMVDSMEWMCDEMILHLVNGIPLTPATVKDNFLLLDEYRD